MNREDIIQMARESGLHLPYWADDEDPEKDPPRWTMVSPLPPLLERFAALVAAAARAEEREACAKVVEASPSYDWHRFACEAAAAIRARKENT